MYCMWRKILKFVVKIWRHGCRKPFPSPLHLSTTSSGQLDGFSVKFINVVHVHEGNDFLIWPNLCVYCIDLGAQYVKRVHRENKILDFFNSASCLQLRLSPVFSQVKEIFFVSMAKINMSIFEKSTGSDWVSIEFIEFFHFLSFKDGPWINLYVLFLHSWSPYLITKNRNSS